MSKRTITLTDRPPVTVDEAAWPVLAVVTDEDYHGQISCQANRETKWGLRVRQHADGRAIVYATYAHSSQWAGERDENRKAGVLLPVGSDAAAIVAAVKEVVATMSRGNDDGCDAWDRLADDCIAALPAEVLS